MECVYCRIRDGEVAAITVYENDRTLAIMATDPVNDGHALVLTKAHVESLYDLSPVDCGAVLLTAKFVSIGIRKVLHPEGLTLILASGPAACQAVPHVHMHVIPRWLSDGKGLHLSPTLGNLDRIRGLGERIRLEIPTL
jgi:histidine triad (HIT) family protein